VANGRDSDETEHKAKFTEEFRDDESGQSSVLLLLILGTFLLASVALPWIFPVCGFTARRRSRPRMLPVRQELWTCSI